MAQVGETPITGVEYDHWMSIGAATVEKPKTGHPLPRPVVYEPPAFLACIARGRSAAPTTSAAQLKMRCEAIYRSIQRRILGFLITGFWLREAAQEDHLSITAAEVRNKFEEERRMHYPTEASFRRLERASRQTIPDLEFAVRSRILSSKLLERYAKRHGDEKNEEAAVPGFNQSIRDRWIARTSCETGYVVPDCKQYKS